MLHERVESAALARPPVHTSPVVEARCTTVPLQVVTPTVETTSAVALAFRTPASRLFQRFLARTVDVLLSAMVLCLVAPLLVIFAAAIKLESSGPVFYRATRAGWRGSTVKVLKFRKMHEGATGHALTGPVDPRFTRLGRLLARTRVDELPQLWNVLRGEMSLVGPRPEHPSFVALHEAEYAEILRVRPGITGLGQLAFAREAEILDQGDPIDDYVSRILPQKVRLDRLYVRTSTVATDLRILWWTMLPVLLRVDVAVDRSTGALTVRRRKPHGV